MVSSHLDHPRYLNEISSGEKRIESFGKYMARVGDPIVELYQVPSKNAEKMKYAFVPKIYRCYMKIIIDFICGLHKQERKSVKTFGESNIVFDRGTFVHRLKDKDRARDFRLLRDVLAILIYKYNHHEYQIPMPILILLYILNDYRYFEDYHGVVLEDILPNHLGIQSHDTVLDYMRNFHEKSSFLRNGEEESYKKATQEMYRRHKNWTRKFNGSDSQVGPLADVFNFHNGKAFYGAANHHILRFCRHNAAHLHQHLTKYTASDFSSKDIELIIMAFFDKELLSFQRMTYRHNIHPHFIPDYASSSSTTGWRDNGYVSKKECFPSGMCVVL